MWRCTQRRRRRRRRRRRLGEDEFHAKEWLQRRESASPTASLALVIVDGTD